MSTVRDLVEDSLKDLGVLSSGESCTANEMSDCIRSLNRMLATWSIDGLLIYQRVIESFPLVASQQTYTMGPTGNFDTVRPVAIESAMLVNNGTDMDIDLLTSDQWAEESQKTMSSTIPTKLYAVGSFPLETLILWPVPTEVHDLRLFTRKPFTAFASANDVVSLPPGYESAIVPNLAVMVASMFGKQVSEMIMMSAIDTLAQLKRQNMKPSYMKTDAPKAHASRINILTGE